MSTNNKISLYRLIGNVCGNLGIKNVNQHLDDFARWSVDAELKIGTSKSKERVECEIEVKNRRACLPAGFCGFISLKYGHEIIDVTKKDFRMFNKSAKTPVTDDSCPKFVGGNLQTTTPGVVLAMRVTLAGSYVSGDVIVITVNINKCGTLSSNSFTYVVQPGDTLTTIATQFAADINAIPNLGYTAVSGAGIIDIVASTVDVTFVLGLFTDSVLGTITSAITQKHVPSTACSTVVENCDTIVNQGSINLADLHSAEINTGASRQGSNALNSMYFGFDVGRARTFTIDNGYLFVNFMDEGKLGIAYYRICLDEDGWPLIDESHETAVTAYCEWMYKRREYLNGKLSGQVSKDLEYRWYWLCGQVRGNDEMPSKAEMIYLSTIWNGMLPMKNLNSF